MYSLILKYDQTSKNFYNLNFKSYSTCFIDKELKTNKNRNNILC